MSGDAVTVVREIPEVGALEYVERPKSRGYYLRRHGEQTRERLVSVTGVLNVLAKPALIRWAEEKGAAGAVRAERMGELVDVDPSEAVHRVRALGLGADAARNEAAGRGLDTHSVLETWMTEGEPPNVADYPADVRGYIQGVARWLIAEAPELIWAERIVCHPRLRYAGRADLRARIGGRDVIVDLKTNRSGTSYPEAHIQVAAYTAAEVECGEDPPDGTLVVCVGPDGTYEALHGLAGADSFEHVLDCYRLMGDVRSRVEATRRATSKAAEAVLA
jgi:genome maintenance exonuclease 1